MFTAFGYLILGSIVRRNLQYIIDFKLKKTAYITSFIMLIVLIFAGVNMAVSVFDNMLIVFVIIIALALLGFYQHASIIESSKSIGNTANSKRSIGFKLLLNNKKTRMLLIISLIFKIIIIGILVYQTYKGDELIFSKQPVFWLFCTPILFFSYFYNNIWSFWPSLMMNLDLRAGDYKTMVKQVLKLMKLPLIIDFLLSIPLLYVFKDNLIFIILFYITSIIFLIGFSFFWSALLTKNVKKLFQRSGTTSAWASVASMGGVAILTLMQINEWFYFLSPFFIISSAVAYWFSEDIFKDNKHKIYERILK